MKLFEDYSLLIYDTVFIGNLLSTFHRRFFVDCPEEWGSQPVCNISNSNQ